MLHKLPLLRNKHDPRTELKGSLTELLNKKARPAITLPWKPSVDKHDTSQPRAYSVSAYLSRTSSGEMRNGATP